MNTPTTDFLLDLKAELETDIRDCLRLLEAGQKEALQELEKSRDEVGSSLISARETLLGAAEETRHQVEAVQQSLGRLGMALHQFVLTDPLDIEDEKAFDTWREQVLAAFENAREELGRIQSRGDQRWKSHLEKVWRRFGQKLEMVRLHLAMGRERAQEEMEAERARLRERLNALQTEIRRNPHAARETIEKMARRPEGNPEWSRLGGWLKALLMWKDTPAPKEVRKELGESRSQS